MREFSGSMKEQKELGFKGVELKMKTGLRKTIATKSIYIVQGHTGFQQQA